MSQLEFPVELSSSDICKAIVELVAEKQKRIDRLELLIFNLYQTTCHGKDVITTDDDEVETVYFQQILDQYNKLKDNDTRTI